MPLSLFVGTDYVSVSQYSALPPKITIACHAVDGLIIEVRDPDKGIVHQAKLTDLLGIAQEAAKLTGIATPPAPTE